MASSIESDLQSEMERLYAETLRDCGYPSTRFIRDVRANGGVATAKRLLDAPPEQFHDGILAILECYRLDLSVEAVALEERFRTLFTSAQLKTAETRLELLRKK